MAMTPLDRNRSRYDETLRHIESDLIRMGHLVLDMVALGTRIALEDDPALLDQVSEDEKQVDLMEDDILHRVLVTLALEGPVAHDLLLLTATMATASELEKIGDEAIKYAARICKLHGGFIDDFRDMLSEMSRQTQDHLKEALRLYNQFSVEAADRLISYDDAIDQAYKVSRNMVLEKIRQNPEDARQLLRCTEIFHALEHISDHTVDIAKRLKGCYERFATQTDGE